MLVERHRQIDGWSVCFSYDFTEASLWFCPVNQVGPYGLNLLLSTTASQEQIYLFFLEKCHVLVGDCID